MQNTLFAADGTPLAVREWPSATTEHGTVVLVHGLGEHAGRYQHVANFLNVRGWRVVGHDHRGHGASGGERGRLQHADDLLVDLALVLDAARVGHPGPTVLLGHSLGGLVAARFVLGTMEADTPAWARAVDALVLTSPALDIELSAPQRTLLMALAPLAPNHAVGNGLQPAWLSRDPAVVAAYRADSRVHDRVTPRLTRFIVDAGEAVRAAAPAWTVPTLLLWAGAAAAEGEVTAHEFPALFHEILNEPEQGEVLSFIGQWLDTLAFSSSRSRR